MMEAAQVTVIGHDAATIDALRNYLSQAGVASQSTRSLPAAKKVKASTKAVVIFPDEFGVQEVLDSIASLRSNCPSLLILLVTSMPQSFHPVVKPDGRSVAPLTFPKPAFGWTLVDAIRAHAGGNDR